MEKYDVEKRKIVWKLRVPSVQLCVESIQGGLVVSGSLCGRVGMVGPAGREWELLGAHEGPVSCLSYEEGGKLISGSWDGRVKLFDVTKRVCLHTWDANERVYSLSRCHAGAWLRHVRSGKQGDAAGRAGGARDFHEIDVNSVDKSGEKCYITALLANGTLQTLDIRSWTKPVRAGTLDSQTPVEPHVSCIDVDPSGGTFIVGCAQAEVFVQSEDANSKFTFRMKPKRARMRGDPIGVFPAGAPAGGEMRFPVMCTRTFPYKEYVRGYLWWLDIFPSRM